MRSRVLTTAVFKRGVSKGMLHTRECVELECEYEEWGMCREWTV